MSSHARYFGTDGIRGRANAFPMTAETALRLGQAAGRLFRTGPRRHNVVIGKDTRLSGYMIESALVAGTTSVGMDVFLLGPVPTPAVAFLTRSLRADLGLVITASHNGYRDNGIKLFAPDGLKLSDETQSRLEQLMDDGLNDRLAPPEAIGRAVRVDDATARYIEFAKQSFPKEQTLEGVRLVLDCANGAAYKAAPAALRELGADLVVIGDAPNGRNINRDCGAVAPERMAKAVIEAKADLGIALDGDADRAVFADEQGKMIDGDQILACLASHWSKRGRLAKNSIAVTVASNLGLEKFLRGQNIAVARTQVGDRYVGEYMRANGLNLGGETSGHIVLADFSSTGDGLIAGLQLLAILREQGQPASRICRPFVPVPSLARTLPAQATLLNDAVSKKCIASAQKQLGKQGRLLVRPSGTEPVVRILAESANEPLLQEVVDTLTAQLAARAVKTAAQ